MLVGANLCIGNVLVPADHIPGAFRAARPIPWKAKSSGKFCPPRVLSAVLLGGALSLSGFLLQTFFNNPIADPFILGVSSGAKFVVALTMIVLLGANQAMSSPAMVAAAFLESLITIGFVLLIARRISSMAMLIVAGIMVGYICSAATNFLIAFADDQSIVNLHNWSLGSFSGSSWDDIAVIAVVVITVSACVVRDIEAPFRLPAGRSLREKRRRERRTLPRGARPSSEHALRLRDRVRWSGVVRRHRGSASREVGAEVVEAHPRDSCVLLGRRHLLRGLRFDRAHAVLSRRAFHQRRHRHLRRAGGYRAHAEEAGEVDGGIRAAAQNARRGVEPRNPGRTQADGAPLFRISDLSAGYDKKVVVEGVDLEVRAGDVVALIGPNGSGKSTILKTITRHLAPLAGAVELDGREISRWKTAEFARNLAVMLTDRPRTELLTCRDIVEAGRHPYTGRMGTLSPDDHSRVDEAMKTAHVEELAERDFMQISDGQRQRVMLARAIAQDPRVLVLDEPTSYLDIRYQIDLLRILRHLAKSRNVAVIMSIHELELAQKSADKVICVKDGRVFRAGAPEDIFTRETIGELYGLQHGTFNERFGSVEIGRPHGDAHTFVIAGAGTGSTVFRQLIRQGKAFYAGVLHEGDIDCELARDLATECVAERAFEPIGDKTIARAKELLVHCARLIVCPAAFGTINARNAELVAFARSHGIEVMRAREGASEDSNGYA